MFDRQALFSQIREMIAGWDSSKKDEELIALLNKCDKKDLRCWAYNRGIEFPDPEHEGYQQIVAWMRENCPYYIDNLKGPTDWSVPFMMSFDMEFDLLLTHHNIENAKGIIADEVFPGWDCEVRSQYAVDDGHIHSVKYHVTPKGWELVRNIIVEKTRDSGVAHVVIFYKSVVNDV